MFGRVGATEMWLLVGLVLLFWAGMRIADIRRPARSRRRGAADDLGSREPPAEAEAPEAPRVTDEPAAGEPAADEPAADEPAAGAAEPAQGSSAERRDTGAEA
jgi:hypothetical protein